MSPIATGSWELVEEETGASICSGTLSCFLARLRYSGAMDDSDRRFCFFVFSPVVVAGGKPELSSVPSLSLAILFFFLFSNYLPRTREIRFCWDENT